ncbi:putative serine/threonine-protein kinase PBL19 [Heracleum sosnowskyi]|uniref:non-specific serine/threonine protein kinase n=1 Tax=Heracleum sosnowskyi TaxID=360622 RepID=A0AAD8GUC4_9APIA|nr:putative serine/threonine-protein kinase PBL19 [Heracleum sosnowskyi]
MKCFPCSSGEKSGEQKTIRSSVRSSSTSVSGYPGAKKSGSEFNSLDLSDTSVESNGRKSFASLSQKPSTLRVYTVSELKTATKNFSRSLMLGEGGFGGVYRGVVSDAENSNKKIDIAVKQLSRRGLQGHKEWVTEVNVLGIVEHQNLVKLVGYSAEDDERGIERLLVYEYMSNRSVLDHLSSRSRTPLPWVTRMKIAQDAARGLAYLHEGMDFQIIFRDFKSSNILLDEQWNAKLSDFGLARLGPSDGSSHVSTAVVGTVGYAAPEYMQTGRLTAKSDVWSYGIFLYELITGRRPLDTNRPKNEQKLLEWVRPHLADMKKFQLILDPRLNGKYSIKSSQRLASIANRCLVRKSKLRPKMSEVLEMVNLLMETTETETPQIAVKIIIPKDSRERSLKEGLKKRLVDPIVGENRSLVWQTWRPKLVTDSPTA